MSGTKERPHIREGLLGLTGQPAWGLVRTHGSMFFIEIGKPVLSPGQIRAHGEWHFLIECCHWRFETADKILVGSEDDQQFIDRAFEKLELGSVENAEVLASAHDLLVKFNSGIAFRTFATSSEATTEWTQWLLHGPDDYTWVSDGGGHVKCITGDEPVR
jgi:hypothetical protein